MSLIVVKNWWSLTIRGLAAILLGALTLIWRHMTIDTVALFFATYAVFDGLVAIAGAVRAAEEHERWHVLMIEGIVGVVAAILLFSVPGSLSTIYVIAGWALLTGVLELLASVQLRQHIPGEWLFATSGVASLVLGIVMVSLPLAGVLTVAVWIASYALIFGVLLLGLGYKVRSLVRHPAISAEFRSA